MKKIILFTFVCILTTFAAVPASPAGWEFYGSARVQTFVEKDDYGSLGIDGRKSVRHSLQSNACIGARVNAGDRLTGGFEYGTGVTARMLYGEWDFGPGTLLVGQAYSPLNMRYAGQVWWDDTNLLDFGGLFSGRNPMIRLKIGEFRIAAVAPASPGIGGLTDTEVTLPKIEARYRFSGEDWFVDIAGGYNSYEISGNTGTYDIDSWIAAMGWGADLGRAYVRAGAWVGENTGSYRLINQPMDSPFISVTTQTLNDNQAFAFILVAGFRFNDTVCIEAGYGHTEAEPDIQGSHEDAISTWYVQSRITLAPGVRVVPEVGGVDWQENTAGVDQGETLYWGAKWQIDF